MVRLIKQIRPYIAVTLGVATLITYLVYQYYYFTYNIKLNELNFSVTTFTIGIYSALIYSYIKGHHLKSLMMLIGGFYLLLDIIYIYRWVILGRAYTDVKISLIFGLIIAFIYWLYGVYKSYRGA